MKKLFFIFLFLPTLTLAQQEAKHWQTTIDFGQQDVRDIENPDYHLKIKNKVLVDLFYQSLKAPLFKDLFQFDPCMNDKNKVCLKTGMKDETIFRITLFATDLTTGKMIGAQNEFNFSTCNTLDDNTCVMSFKVTPEVTSKPDQNTKVLVNYSVSVPVKIELKTDIPYPVVFSMGVRFRGERTYASQNEHASMIACAECTENKTELTTSHTENNFDYTLYLRRDSSDQSDNHDHQGAIDCNNKDKCEPLRLVNY